MKMMQFLCDVFATTGNEFCLKQTTVNLFKKLNVRARKNAK